MKLLDRIWKKIIGLGTGEIGGCDDELWCLYRDLKKYFEENEDKQPHLHKPDGIA